MKKLSIFCWLFANFFLLQSMNAPNGSDNVPIDAPDSSRVPIDADASGNVNVEIVPLQKAHSFHCMPGSVNYPLKDMGKNPVAKTLSLSQLNAMAPDMVTREDSPPEVKKIRKKRSQKVCDSADIKQQLLEDQRKITLKLTEQLETLSKKKNNNKKRSRSVSKADRLLATLRDIHAKKKDEESSEEES